MITQWLIRRYGATAAARIGRIAGWVGLALLGLALLAAVYFTARTYFAADLTSRVKVIAGQLGAQAASSKDAVETISNTTSNEQAIDEVTRENVVVIEQAQGAGSAVDPSVRAAGLRALCSRKAYRDANPTCMQRAAAR